MVLEMAQSIRCLLPIHNNPSLNPQHPHKKLGTDTYLHMSPQSCVWKRQATIWAYWLPDQLQGQSEILCQVDKLESDTRHQYPPLFFMSAQRNMQSTEKNVKNKHRQKGKH